MAQCPKCGATLKDDYGMSQCTSCGVFCFIDMEGNAFVSEPEAEATPNPTKTKAPPVPTSTRIPAPPPPDVPAVFEFQPSIEPEASPEFEPPALEMPTDQASPTFEAAPEGQAEPDFQAFSFDPPPESVSPMEAPIPDLGPADDPIGVSNFANSEISSAKDGPLLFRILVSGIDSKEMRETIREVLEDPRFGWEADQMFARLEKGVLTIENLSPVKASILVSRIKRLPVKIRWEQYAVSQVDPTP